jgi:hypothetical protein
MNAIKPISLIRQEVGLLPKSQPLIRFQTSAFSLLTQPIKKAAAYLIHQTGQYCSLVGSRM